MLEVNVTGTFEQMLSPGFALMLTLGTASGFTVIVTLLLVAVVGFAHSALLVTTTFTASPDANVVLW
jgi:hypothetical protein